MQDSVKIGRAIISVWDKTDLDRLVLHLYQINPKIQIIASAGTFKKIHEIAEGEKINLDLIEVAEFTGVEEMPSGLVKTLHPRIYAGLLADTDNTDDVNYVEKHKVPLIDLVISNLYPFEKVVTSGLTFEECRNYIDVGGPTMIRAGAKNFKRVTVVTDNTLYDKFLDEVKSNNGSISLTTRFEFAKMVYDLTGGYDNAISSFFERAEVDKFRSSYL